jgi:hypothetical protein
MRPQAEPESSAASGRGAALFQSAQRRARGSIRPRAAKGLVALTPFDSVGWVRCCAGAGTVPPDHPFKDAARTRNQARPATPLLTRWQRRGVTASPDKQPMQPDQRQHRTAAARVRRCTYEGSITS